MKKYCMSMTAMKMWSITSSLKMVTDIMVTSVVSVVNYYKQDRR